MNEKTGYSFRTTILLFGFGAREQALTDAALKDGLLADGAEDALHHVRIYCAENATDIVGIPYFWAAINVEALKVWEYKEISEFMSEIYKRGEDSGLYMNITTPVVHLVGKIPDNETHPQFFNYRTSFFDDPKEIRYSIRSSLNHLPSRGC